MALLSKERKFITMVLEQLFIFMRDFASVPFMGGSNIMNNYAQD